jgi:hypothetical protein
MKMMFVNFGTSAEEAKLEANKPVEAVEEIKEETVAEENKTEETTETPATEESK